MNHSRALALTFSVLLILGCEARGKLTNNMAEGALKRWASSGDVTVTGIQEIPQENAAKVDVTFSNFKFKSTGIMGGKVERNYSGPGVAVFTHYNDGRWVLTKVSTSQGFDSVWWDNLNIEAR
jgi:hypothetical protein